MRYRHLLASLCCVYGITVADAGSQNLRDHVGKEFIVVFGPNTGGEPNVETNNEMSIVLTTTTPANVTIEAIGVNWTRQKSLAAGVSEMVVLPSGNNSGPSVMLQRTDNEKVTPRAAVHVTSDADISVIGRNHKRFSSDAFLALPVDALGRSYRVISYPVSQGQGAPLPSQFMIAAIEHNTEVQITLTSNTASGRKKGETFTVTLDKLDAYLVQSSVNSSEDLTGSLIEANKPIAVFSGHERAAIPEGAVLYDGSPASRDHLVEQLPPVEAFGDTFFVVPFTTSQRPDVVRIAAAYPDTRVFVGGEAVADLQAGEAHTIQQLTSAEMIVASRPVLVAQYLTTSLGRLGDPHKPAWGDPAMTIVPPVEQYVNIYSFAVLATPAGEGEGAQFLNVILPTEAYSSTTIDGRGLGAVTAIAGSGYVQATTQITPTRHELRSSHPVGVTVYGFTSIESYALPAGMGVEPGGLTKSDVRVTLSDRVSDRVILIGEDRVLRIKNCDQPSELEIYDRAGRLIERLGTAPEAINLLGYAAGIYFFRTSERKGSFLIP